MKQYAAKRAELKEIIRNPKTSDEEKMDAAAKLQKLPRDASPIAPAQPLRDHRPPARRLPQVRPGRTKLREATMRGDIPGLRKASW